MKRGPVVSTVRWLVNEMKVPVRVVAAAINTTPACVYVIINEGREPARNKEKSLKFVDLLLDHHNNPKYVYQLARARFAREQRVYTKKPLTTKPKAFVPYSSPGSITEIPSFNKKRITVTTSGRIKGEDLDLSEFMGDKNPKSYLKLDYQLPQKYINNQYLLIVLLTLIIAFVIVTLFVR